MRTGTSGSTLESLLREDGTYEDAKNDAVKSVLAYKLEQAMKDQSLSKARMAERMETSRSQLDRLLDPENDGVTLHTLKRAAAAVGMRLELELRLKPKFHPVLLDDLHRRHDAQGRRPGASARPSTRSARDCCLLTENSGEPKLVAGS